MPLRRIATSLLLALGILITAFVILYAFEVVTTVPCDDPECHDFSDYQP